MHCYDSSKSPRIHLDEQETVKIKSEITMHDKITFIDLTLMKEKQKYDQRQP